VTKLIPTHILSYFKDNFYYLGVNLGTSLLGFITFPIITHSLGPEDYGTLALYGTLFSLVNSIGFLGLNTAVTRFVAGKENIKPDSQLIAKIINNVLLHSLLLSMIFFLLIQTFHYYGHFDKNLVIIFSIYGFLQILVNVLTMLARALKRFYVIANNKMLIAILSMIGVLIYYFMISLSIRSIILVQIMSTFFGFIFLYIVLKNAISFRAGFDLNLFKRMIKYGFPLVFGFAYIYVFKFSDRFFLLNFLNMESIGLYHAADKISKLADIPLIPIGMVLFPTLMKYQKKMETDRIFSIINTTQVLLIIYIGVIMVILIPNVENVYHVLSGFELKNNILIITALASALVFQKLQYIFIIPLMLIDKTKIIGVCYAILCLVNLILNYFLIKHYGLIGAALATLLIPSAFYLFNVNLSNRYYKTKGFSINPRAWISVATSVLVTIAIITRLDIGYKLSFDNENIDLLINVVVNSLIGLLIYLFLLGIMYYNRIRLLIIG